MNTTEGIEIRHTRAEGTLVYGTAKGDGSADILKAHRFRWFRSIGVWGIQSSRDKEAQHWRIDNTAAALRDAGFTVTVHIDESVRRTIEDAEADRSERSEARADRFAQRASKAAARSEALRSDSDRITDGYQGEPIKIGHHSEARHRRDLERAHNKFGQSIAEHDNAQHYTHRAEAAANHQRFRESVRVTLRRIERLEADLHRWQRERDNAQAAGAPMRVERCKREITDLTEQIGYWKKHIDEFQAANPDYKIWGPDDFTKGDFAKLTGTWHEVIRINPKSLSVAWNVRHHSLLQRAGEQFSHPRRIPYHQVFGRASAEDINAAIAKSGEG